jgi:hypothetical protein
VGDVHRKARVLGSSASSATRVLKEHAMVAERLADGDTRNVLRQVAKPNSISKTMRKAGIGLLLAPDPVTAVPGAMLLGASLAMKGKEPLSPASVLNEARKLLAEIGSSF